MKHNILIAVDTADNVVCDAILAEARTYAVPGARLHMVHVVPEEEALGPLSQFVPDGFSETHRAETHAKLDDLSRQLGADADVTLHMRTGNAYVEILDLAESIGAELIVIGASRPDLSDFLLGPKAARVVRHARCSVLVVRT